MQNWEFKNEIANFKKEVIQTVDLDTTDFIVQIDKKTDEFLKKHGIELAEDNDISEQ
jgi:hypothetical protein